MKIALWWILAALSSVSFGHAAELLNEKSFVAKMKNLLESHGGKVKIDESVREEEMKKLWERVSKDKATKNGVKLGTERFGRQKDDRRSMADSQYWTLDEKKYLLNKHNHYRGNTSVGLVTDDGTDGYYPTSSNMNSVFWDDAIAAVAQNHSESCLYKHNSNRNTQFYNYKQYATFEYPSSGIYMGENIAEMTSSYSQATLDVLRVLADLWFNEHVDWHYQTCQKSNINSAGHFTQLVWANTRYIGCGYAICDEGSTTMYYLVCDYYPGGNYLGEYPYVSGSNYGDCDPDRTAHSDGLCAGCMSSAYTVDSSATTADDCSSGLNNTAATTSTAVDTTTSTSSGTTTSTSSGTTTSTSSGTTTSTSSIQTGTENPGSGMSNATTEATGSESGASSAVVWRALVALSLALGAINM